MSDRQGICGVESPRLFGEERGDICILRHGHGGWHEGAPALGEHPMRWSTDAGPGCSHGIHHPEQRYLIQKVAEPVLIAHQRRGIGGCSCGWDTLGASFAAHVGELIADAVMAVMLPPMKESA